MQTQTYKAGVSPKFLDHITNFFGRDYANIGYELIQNSWRAGANQVDVEFITEPVYGKSDRVILKVRDNGHGTDFSKILQAGESGWGESVVKEHPAGMGLFSLVGILGSCDVELVSVTKNKRFETDLVREHFTGQQILNVSSSESKEEEHTTLIISCDYDSRNTVAALKSIVTAIVEAALHCHPDKFDPYNNYVKVHCSVDTTSEAKFLFAGAYALLDAEGKPKLDLHKEEQDVVPGVDVYRTNLQNHGPTYYCVAVMNGSFIELAGGSGCIVPYRGIKPFPVADIYLEHNRSTNFVYHGKSISLGVSGDYLENDVATSELIRDLNDRNGNKGGTFWETQNRFSASEVKRPKVCNVIFIKDAAVMPMTHPERNSFVASDDTSRTIRKLVNHLYGMYRDDIKNAYHERQPGKDVIHRHLLDADMMTKWRFCRAIKCVSSCHSAPASLVSYVSSDIYRKEGTFQVVTESMVDLLLDQEMVRTGQPVVAYNQSMLLGISRLWPVKLEGVHSLFPVEAVVTSETSNTYYYPSGTLDVEIAVLKNPKLARKVFHIEGGRESEELELLDWNEPLFLGDMCDEFIDVTLAKAEVAEEESDLAHLMECWDKDNRYCGESDKMNIVMSKEQALSCLGVYDGLIEERMGWYDSFYGDDEDLSVTAFCSRLMSSTQIDAGLVIKSSDEDIARNATGERLECESFITYLHSINHPCLRQPDKPMSLNLEVQIKCGLLHITEAKVLEEKEEK